MRVLYDSILEFISWTEVHEVHPSRASGFEKLRESSFKSLRGSKNISLNPSSKRDLPAVLFYSLMTGRIYTSGAPL